MSKLFSLTFFLSLIVVLSYSFADEFNDFVKQTQADENQFHQEFNEYKKEIEQEFHL